MNWLVFGEDWQGLISTTRHLATAMLAAGDRVVWVNSLGMRSPGLNRRDLLRLVQKARACSRTEPGKEAGSETRGPDVVISPRILPFHRLSMCRRLNRRLLGRQLRPCLASFPPEETIVLSSNPVAAYYLPERYKGLVYLRLDDYPRLPGVDHVLARVSEARIMELADLIAVTARPLLPLDVSNHGVRYQCLAHLPSGKRLQGAGDARHRPAMCTFVHEQADNTADSVSCDRLPLDERPAARSLYLPQGVDLRHFATVPLEPPRGRTLGFFGFLAEWIDYELIMQTAVLLPDWTLELRGEARYVPDRLAAHGNIKLLPPVPYSGLPAVIAHWDAAWLPFQRSALTEAVNPLKVREYLAAGLPTVSVGLPEVLSLPYVKIIVTAADVATALPEMVAGDSPDRRRDRRNSVREHGWEERCRVLKETLASRCP